MIYVLWPPDYMSINSVSACLSDLSSWRFNKPLKRHIQIHTHVILFYLKPDSSPSLSMVTSSKLLRPKHFWFCRHCLFFLITTSNVSAHPVSSAFPAWPLPDHFWPASWLLPWLKPPSSGVWIVMVAF